MCDMQQLPSREDVGCEEEDMNFATFSAGGAGAHFVTTPLAAKYQPQPGGMPQMVSVMGGDGVQYVRALDASLAPAPQIITVPIALPGAKPGDPQQTVQIQVMPQLLQQPKFQMQIPIQGFQQGVLTLAYAQDGSEGLQLLGNGLPEGLQVVALPQEMVQPSQPQQDNKDHVQQMFASPATNNNVLTKITIKEECDDSNEDESSQSGGGSLWPPNQHLVEYLNKLPPQQAQALPASLQQFLKMNPAVSAGAGTAGVAGADEKPVIHIEILPEGRLSVDHEDDEQPTKKKKKYKKKPPKPAKPKPGQVVIATAADGSAVFCCPECQLAYGDKEQLETHLAVHKIERRFICGICGAGLKRKEHLERHKLGHNPERPYVCAVCRKGFKRREHLNLHAAIHSGVKTELCLECGKGFYRKDHLRKHRRSHETKRARDGGRDDRAAPLAPAAEITIHVPTSGNIQVPVQINIPQHVASSLAAQSGQATQAQSPLDALLLQHT